MAAVKCPIRPRTRSVRAGAWRFFQLRPALLGPVLNAFVVAFDSTSGWSLPRPVQLVAQHIPDMSWVVRDSGHSRDDFSHARQGPQVVGVPTGFSALDECLLDRHDLLVTQFRLASCATGAPQRVTATLTPGFPPVRDDLMRN